MPDGVVVAVVISVEVEQDVVAVEDVHEVPEGVIT